MTSLSSQTTSSTPSLTVRVKIEQERRRRQRVRREAELEAQAAVWRTNPKLYAKERLNVDLTNEQGHVLESIRDNRRTAVKASHAIGKTFNASVALNWWYDCWKSHIGYITAPTWGQALGLTFKEVKKMRLTRMLDGEVLDSGLVRDAIKIRQTDHFIKALNAEKSEGFQGEHSAPILIVLEEAVGVPSYIWDAMEGLMTHPECFVADTLVSAGEIMAATSRFYQGRIVKIATASNRNISVTPNHPILTNRGWIVAKSIKKGDKLVASDRPESVSAGIVPNKENTETVIGDVFQSLSRTGGNSSRKGNGLQFHGDGSDSEVNIVYSASLLRNKTNGTLSHKLSKYRFPFAQFSHLLNGCRSLTSSFRGLFATLCRNISRLCQSLFLGYGHLRHSQSVSLGNGSCFNVLGFEIAKNTAFGNAVPNRQLSQRLTADIFTGKAIRRRPFISGDTSANDDTSISKFSGERFTADANLVRELFAMFPSDVSFDEVVEVFDDDFSGQVYNLQTKNNWYFANGIVAHNCRVLAIGNPTDEATKFGEVCESAAWEVFSVTAMAHPNIEEELHCRPPKFEAAVRLQWLFEMLQKECEQVSGKAEGCFEFYTLAVVQKALNGHPVSDSSEKCYYKPTAFFEGRVLGEFPTEASNKVIPSGWIKSLPVLPINLHHQIQLGCDVARFGDDRTTIFSRIGSTALQALVLRKFDTLAIIDKIESEAEAVCKLLGLPVNNAKSFIINIDTTGGLGAGPYDTLKSRGYRNVQSINSSESAYDAELYKNKRSELWFDIRDRVRDKNIDMSRLDMEIRRTLVKELSTPMYKVVGGKKVVEDKSETKKRLGASPDLADGFNLAFYESKKKVATFNSW